MDTDVLVVGAGPTGLMLACELALAGVRTRIVERRTEPQRDSRALTLHPRSVELMDMRGLAPRFLAFGKPVPGWHFAGLDTRLDFAALDSRHGYTLFLAQARTEALLEERAGELGVRISRGHETTGLRQDATGVDVEVRGPGGAVDTIRAQYAVGCDGGRSLVRQAAGIGFPGTDETLTGMLGDFADVDADPAVLAAARARGVLVVPLEGGLTRFVCIDPERMRIPAGQPVTLEAGCGRTDRRRRGGWHCFPRSSAPCGQGLRPHRPAPWWPCPRPSRRNTSSRSKPSPRCHGPGRRMAATYLLVHGPWLGGRSGAASPTDFGSPATLSPRRSGRRGTPARQGCIERRGRWQGNAPFHRKKSRREAHPLLKYAMKKPD